MKILVVDDERLIRKAFARWFKEHDVVELSSVSIAIDFMEKSKFSPDVILCDNNTGPGPTGIEFAERLSELEYKGRFVLCTSDFLGDLEKRVTALGCRFVSKPAMMRDIIEAIN